MATTPNSIVTPQTPKNGVVQILPADTTTQKTVFTAGSNGSKVTGLVLSSTDTSARDVAVSVTRSGTSYLLGTVTLPIGAGFSGAVPAVNGLTFPGLPADSDGNPYLLLLSGDTLTVAALTTVTAAKVISAVVCAAGDF